MPNADNFPKYGDLELCIDVRAHVQGGAYIKRMWGRFPRVDMRCLSSEEKAENRKDTEEMHTASRVQLLVKGLGSAAREDGITEKVDMVLYSQKDRAAFFDPPDSGPIM